MKFVSALVLATALAATSAPSQAFFGNNRENPNVFTCLGLLLDARHAEVCGGSLPGILPTETLATPSPEAPPVPEAEPEPDDCYGFLKTLRIGDRVRVAAC